MTSTMHPSRSELVGILSALGAAAARTAGDPESCGALAVLVRAATRTADERYRHDDGPAAPVVECLAALGAMAARAGDDPAALVVLRDTVSELDARLAPDGRALSSV